MSLTRFLTSHITPLSWFRHSRWLLLSFILGGFFADSKADGPPTAADLSNVEITLQRSV